jgi:glycosyltransferase involved in cell wall biosynthesis
MHEVWPEAPIYTAIVDRAKMAEQGWDFSEKKITTSWMQPIWHPLRKLLPRYYFTLFFIPAFMSFGFGKFEVILSSASYAAKYIRKGKALHISYIHTPPRFLWGYDTDINVKKMNRWERGLSQLLRGPIKWLDLNRARSVDYFIANSKNVAARIENAYGREAEVIYPPVDTKKFAGEVKKDRFYLIVSALGEYKKVDLVVKAFNQLGLPLKVAGDGPQLGYLKSVAQSNVEILGRVSEEEKLELLLSCRAFIFPTEEDFGIAPVEAMAAGKPVLAYGKGGATETIIPGKTGEFFQDQTVEGIFTAMRAFSPEKYSAEDCRARAREFDREIFKRKIKSFVEEKYQNSR